MIGSFTVIGPGRAGRSLAGALVEIGWQQHNTYGRGDDVGSAAVGVDVCIIATPDETIASVAAAVTPSDAVFMHLSGAMPLTVLGSHRAAALHPLASLADPDRGAERLRTCWFAIAGDPIAQDIADQLSGKSFPIADEDRAVYHAAAAVASNHLVALLGHVQRIAEEVDVPFEAFMPLVQGSVENVALADPAAALTGPAARGDDATIEAHLAALSERLPDEVSAYSAMVAEARRLAAMKRLRDDRAN
jgi:predicted short-subunit dehydrogenase-like oxidoreductase (DUF2520 family)